MVEIRLEDVDKIFNQEVEALKDVNLTIQNKEFMVLVGPSGSGKSTCLNIIAGLDHVTEGDIWFGDINVTELSPKERNVAMVFQSYALYPHMTNRENMSFALRLAKRDKDFIDEQVKKAAKILGIEELLDRKPKELSGGQRQRVALGRCIVRNPTVFLFDEPLSNLDAKLRTQMRAEVIKLQKQLETTLVYVTHDQVEAMSMADRITILDQGKIQQVGTPDEVYNEPRNKFVGGFIGSPAMNFIPAELNNHSLKFGENKLELEDEIFEKLENRNSDDLILGIRPEHFEIAKEPFEDGYEITVDVIEYLGAQSLVTIEAKGDIELKVMAQGHYRAKMGSKSYIRFDKDLIHIFDTETEINLMHYPENDK